VQGFHEYLDHGGGFFLLLVSGALLTHYVDCPTGQLCAKSDVLAGAANGLGEVFLCHGDIHGMTVFVYHDGRHFSRRHGVDDQLRRIVIPEDDIDTLVGQLAAHNLHTGAAHTYAGTDRIDTLVVGFHS